jgi:hypothetical protein
MSLLKGGLGAAVVALGVLTNPTPQDYQRHLLRKHCDRTAPSSWVQATCQVIQVLPLPDWLSSRYVTHRNYGLFSVYITSVPGMHDVSLGIGGFFIEIENSTKTPNPFPRQDIGNTPESSVPNPG